MRPPTPWQRLARDSFAVVGAALVAAMVLVGLLAPALPLPEPAPTVLQTANRLKPPGSELYPLGTDELGRDVLSRLVWGARVSLTAGLLASLISVAAGVLIGLVSGSIGGRVDGLIMRGIDVLMAFPGILLAIALVAALGPGLHNAMVAVGLVGIPLFARVVRAEALSLRRREFVLSAVAIGVSPAGILFRHILPNLVGTITVTASLDLGNKILATASLSFLGLGTQPPVPDWGNMLAAGRQYLTVAPHLAAAPGLAIFAVVVGLNVFGEGIRDAFDPRSV